ncbi:site-specific integrase [Alishewanella jeotgali]|uniref:DNA breaking-rejoining enzyme n=1 Tax=Alishewanella jeotgali KCTC 22429 TaxID=1129374 RepID=H3ZE44_9ALTE|nr:site-specific integrase [Alishewanella jeotgali]EHR41221.1 DNA breaking-rejoining enzyme [Alishewanella jeotgali KCTC 22429]
MMNKEKKQLLVIHNGSTTRIPAKAKGYDFDVNDTTWVLDKNVSTNLSVIHSFLSGKVLKGCLSTLSFYASNLSSHHTRNVVERFQHFLRETEANEITDTVLINYRTSLTKATEWYLGTIRGFLRRWYQLGYFGISEEIITLLDGWTIKGHRKGDAVKRKHPTLGPLTDNELQAFNEGVVKAYELDRIKTSDLAISLAASNSGRRPIQISHLRVVDVLCGTNNKGEPFYVLNFPRGKHGEGFRAKFKPFAITHDLWSILSAQAKSAVTLTEKKLGFQLQEQDRQQIPLFPDYRVLFQVTSPTEYRALLASDKLHMSAAEVTDILQFAAEEAGVKSERTGEDLFINARRFRYTTGTRAAREGFGELVIAELLDHSDTQNAGVYVKNIPEHVERLDSAVGFQLAPYAQAFAGVLVDSEKEAKRGDDPTSRIRTGVGKGVGTCGEHGFCGANVPIPCYTCMHFQPWLDGPHKEVYQDLLEERERVKSITGDIQIAAILDRSIVAVADVILRCEKRRADLNEERRLNNG